MKKIALIGGGTAGYVTSNIALFPALRETGYEVLYIGPYEGMERRLIEATGTPYRGISSEELRHCFDRKNFTGPSQVLKGYGEAKVILRDFRPDFTFSKGGCVAVSMTRATKCLGIPAMIHESDMTSELTNRLSYSAVTKICCNFSEALLLLLKDKAMLTGSSIRVELLSGSHEAACKRIGFISRRPVLLMIGGNLGSHAVNASAREVLPDLLKKFQVLYIAGKNNLDPTLSGIPGYRQFGHVPEELKNYPAFAGTMASRVSANAIYEIPTLRRPNVLTPLFAKASRGDQILNARSYEKQGYPRVLGEEALPHEILLAAVRETYTGRACYLVVMEVDGNVNGVAQVMFVLNSVTADRR